MIATSPPTEARVLKPCAHCGSTVIATGANDPDAYGNIMAWIECESCAAGFEFCVGNEEAGVRMCETAWNRRAPEPAAQCDCWETVNAMIKKGPLQGNGCDDTAQRNGIILAANALYYKRHPVPASLSTTKSAGPDLVGALQAGLRKGDRCTCRGNLGEANPECSVHGLPLNGAAK
jgi:hypothetical protein